MHRLQKDGCAIPRDYHSLYYLVHLSRSMAHMASTFIQIIIRAELVPWEGDQIAIAFEYNDGATEIVQMTSREQAERECRRVGQKVVTLS